MVKVSEMWTDSLKYALDIVERCVQSIYVRFEQSQVINGMQFKHLCVKVAFLLIL